MLKGEQLILFIEGLADQIEASVSLGEALASISKSVDEKHQQTLIAIQRGIANGESFSTLIAEYNLLPHKMLPPIAAGEQAGTLPKTLHGLVAHEQSFETVIDNSKKALIPPLTILIGVIFAFFGFLIWVFPNFARNLPSEKRSQGLFWLSQKFVDVYTTTPWLFLVPIVLVAAYIYYLINNDEARQKAFDMSLQIPIYGAGVKLMIWAGWCNYVALSSKAGVSIKESIESTSPMLNDWMASAFELLINDALGTLGWDHALNEAQWGEGDPRAEWPLALTTAFRVGGNTGNLGSSLDKAAKTLKRQGEKQIDKAVVLGNKLSLIIAGIALLSLIASLLLAQLSTITSY